MIFFNRCFKPSWLMTLITLSGVVLFVALGLWQLDRAGYKQAIVDRFEARLGAEYQSFTRVSDWGLVEYRRVILRGRYENQQTLLLDNQLSRGRAGYHVLTPFVLETGEFILVNRGWVAVGASRQTLPVIELPAQANDVKGVVVNPHQAGFRMGDIRLTENWPQVIPFIDIGSLQSGFDNRLLPVIVWLAAEQDGYYERDWQPVWLAPEKSEAYAVQWFSFAIIALVLYFILNLRKFDE